MVTNGREAAAISARERSARAVPDDVGNCRTECGVQNTNGVRSQSTVADRCAEPNPDFVKKYTCKISAIPLQYIAIALEEKDFI